MTARPLESWHEDMGNKTWWALGPDGEWLGEPAWIGTPNDSHWPGYHTHFTDHPPMPETPDESGRRIHGEARAEARDLGLLSY
ncbi:hypothetical protein [Salipiger bermudensis]|uniref:hypothetical protein n=1 Tax=Salipiger bermudensis TaxID=344736 RepID=UPI0002FB5AAB|nr:hypothetical protein [Salipiger bermudensis]